MQYTVLDVVEVNVISWRVKYASFGWPLLHVVTLRNRSIWCYVEFDALVKGTSLSRV